MDNNLLKLNPLSSQEARLALIRHGPNEIGIHPFHILKLLIKEILSPLIILYLIFSLLSFLLGNEKESIAIVCILLFSLMINIINSIKGLHLSKKIKSRRSNLTIVIRDGKQIDIRSDLLVPNDIIYLKTGNMVPADCEILHSNNLYVDESLINGVSFPVIKSIKKNKLKEANTLYYHTFISNGDCYARVIRTGNSITSIKYIDYTIKRNNQYKGFTYNLNKIIWYFLITSSLLISILVLLLLIFNTKEFDLSLIILLVSLMISMIPEALPVINSLSLLNCEYKLSNKGVNINNIDIFEDLADIDLICTDKTGTLTLNELEVLDYESKIPDKKFKYYLNISSISSDDPFDKAIQKYLKENGVNNNKEIKYIDKPFDPFIKSSSRVFEDTEIIKGAPEYVLSNIDFEDNLKLSLKVKSRTQTGERALSLILVKNNKKRYIGTVFFSDPIKHDANDTIKELKEKGIKLKLISGDNLNICTYVAIQTGLIDSKNKCIEASNLRFDSIKVLKQQLDNFDVIARADPISKYKIIEALKLDHKLAYLGDGINDSPSIKLADVGIVVQNSIDIAKYNADIILTDKHLHNLIKSIIESRKIFHNTQEYLSYALSMNFNNFLSIAVLLFILEFFPILPIQLLIGNLLMDIVAIKFAYERVEIREILKPSKIEINKLISLALFLGAINTILDILFFIIFKNIDPSHLQSLWFITAFIADLFFILSVKSKGLFIRNFPSPLFIFNIVMSILIMLVIAIYGIPLISINPIPYDLLPILFITPIIYFIILETAKILISHKLYK